MALMSDHVDSEHFSYSRTWEEMENMLKLAERKQNHWITLFHSARAKNDIKLMQDCARNKKALEEHVEIITQLLAHNTSGVIIAMEAHLNTSKKTLLRSAHGLELSHA